MSYHLVHLHLISLIFYGWKCETGTGVALMMKEEEKEANDDDDDLLRSTKYVTLFSQTSSYFLSLGWKYSPQHLVLKHTQSVLFCYSGRLRHKK
jgi:hypothetical protein